MLSGTSETNLQWSSCLCPISTCGCQGVESVEDFVYTVAHPLQPYAYIFFVMLPSSRETV